MLNSTRRRDLRIAHFSDVHMLSARPTRRDARHALRLRFLSAGRALDPASRVLRLKQALNLCANHRADHIVISGDLTEYGSPEEYDTFAEVLHDSGIPAHHITLVPGNHDVYHSPDAWKQAIYGPLQAFRETSANEPGKIVDLGTACIFPVDVTRHQHISRASGILLPQVADALETRLMDRAIQKRAAILVQHHQPFAHRFLPWQWIDGLTGWARLLHLLHRFQNASVLHGHMHQIVNRMIGITRTRIFGATATVEDPLNASRVRFYRVANDGLLDTTIPTQLSPRSFDGARVGWANVALDAP